MKLVATILAALILIYIGIFIIAVVPYHIYFKKNKNKLKELGITNVNELLEDVKLRKQRKKDL